MIFQTRELGKAPKGDVVKTLDTERSNFRLKYYLNLISRPQIYILRSRNQASESTQLCDKDVFSLIVILQLRRPITELKFSQICFMHAYVEIHQVGRLFFDNY